MFVSISVKYGTINLNQMKYHLIGKQLVNKQLKQFPPLFSLMHSAVRRSKPSPMLGRRGQSGTFYTAVDFAWCLMGYSQSFYSYRVFTWMFWKVLLSYIYERLLSYDSVADMCSYNVVVVMLWYTSAISFWILCWC